MTVYKEAGVNVLSTDNLIREITPLCSKTKRPGKMGIIGNFAGLFDLKMCIKPFNSEGYFINIQ